MEQDKVAQWQNVAVLGNTDYKPVFKYSWK